MKIIKRIILINFLFVFFLAPGVYAEYATSTPSSIESIDFGAIIEGFKSIVSEDSQSVADGGNSAVASSQSQTTTTWTGYADNSALNPGNWTNGIPTAGVDVFFDQTSSTDCNWNINSAPLLNSVNLDYGYVGTISLATDLNIAGNINASSGTLLGNSFTVTVGGDWNFFTGTATPMGDMDGDGSVNTLDVLKMLLIALGDPVQYCSDLNYDSYADILDVILTLRVSNHIDPQTPCTGAHFEPGTSTVVLNGADQTIFGNNTFFNLTKIPSASTLYFEAGSTQIILGSLTLQGSTDNLLALKSTSQGEPWYIDPRGARNVSFVSIEDMINLSLTDIITTNSVDLGNNVNVRFGGSQCTCRDEKLILAGLCKNRRGPC